MLEAQIDLVIFFLFCSLHSSGRIIVHRSDIERCDGRTYEWAILYICQIMKLFRLTFCCCAAAIRMVSATSTPAIWMAKRIWNCAKLRADSRKSSNCFVRANLLVASKSICQQRKSIDFTVPWFMRRASGCRSQRKIYCCAKADWR